MCNREGTVTGRLIELRDPNSNIQTDVKINVEISHKLIYFVLSDYAIHRLILDAGWTASCVFLIGVNKTPTY
jgi:hypothetical protein